jgi:hypothetical protein
MFPFYKRIFIPKYSNLIAKKTVPRNFQNYGKKDSVIYKIFLQKLVWNST